MTLNAKWICGAIAAAAFAIPAVSQVRVGVYLGTPPPIRYETRPAMPGPGYAWQEGYWEPNGGRYRWVAGRWNQPPYAGAYWNHPHYDHYPEGWRMHEGYWAHEDHGGYEGPRR